LSRDKKVITHKNSVHFKQDHLLLRLPALHQQAPKTAHAS